MGLSQWLGREISTAIVGGFFHQWASAVGHAEAEPDHDFFFSIGGVDWDPAKRGPKLLLVTHGTADQIAADFRDKKHLVGYFSDNVSDIIRRLRARGQKVGIDLSRPFFFPPGDPRFDQILTQVKRELEARIARLRRDKNKLAAVKARQRRRDIMSVPRVAKTTYPLAMQELG